MGELRFTKAGGETPAAETDEVAGKDAAEDWRVAEVGAFAASVEMRPVKANRAVCDFHFMKTTLAASYNQDMIANAGCSSYEDGGSRLSYFTGEFFCHDTEAPRS